MMTCCKEKVVLVAVYEERPRKKRLTKGKGKGSGSDNIKHHHHHHHHHIHVHESKNNNNKGNRRAELLSYSQHLRESSKTKASTPPPHPPKSLVASSPTKDQETKIQTITQVHDDQKKQKLKKQSRRIDMNNMFKCFAISYAKRKAKKTTKKKKKKSSESSSHKANLIMKQFSARTQKGASRFFIKLKAFIQKHR